MKVRSTATTTEGISLQWLKPNQLSVEPLAQREFRPTNAERIVKNFDADKVGTFEVSSRDGRHYVIDGQHRRAALIELGMGEIPVPCVVREDQEVTDDAKRFVAANVENVRTNSLDAFRVKVVAGDGESVDIQDVLDSFDLTVRYSSGANDIAAIAALQWVYRRGGKSLLVRTLTLLEATWGRDRTARDGNLIKAYALLLDRIGNQLDLESLADKVKRDSTPGKLLGTARSHRMVTGKPVYVQVADVVVNIYNAGRSTRRVTLA